MTLSPIDQWYHSRSEPNRSCLSVLRQHILNTDPMISESWKYGMPFFIRNGKMFCYLWEHKTEGLPYLGIVDGKLIDDDDLLQEKRARMKIWLIDPMTDIDLKKLNTLLKKMAKVNTNRAAK